MTATPPAVSNRVDWTWLLVGLFAVYALFEWSARMLGSDRGQGGVLVAALVVGALVGIECAWSARDVPAALRALGLGRPRLRGLGIATVVCALMLLVPIHAAATGSTVTVQPQSLALVPGLFAQAGVAEETLFRGFLFRHLRIGRTFWRAAAISMLPFTAVHLVLFLTLPLEIALAALLLAVVMSFPLAYLFELGGATIWAPALLHFVAQAAVKVFAVDGPSASTFPLLWMAASAMLPLLVLVVPRRSRSSPVNRERATLVGEDRPGDGHPRST